MVAFWSPQTLRPEKSGISETLSDLTRKKSLMRCLTGKKTDNKSGSHQKESSSCVAFTLDEALSKTLGKRPGHDSDTFNQYDMVIFFYAEHA